MLLSTVPHPSMGCACAGCAASWIKQNSSSPSGPVHGQRLAHIHLIWEDCPHMAAALLTAAGRIMTTFAGIKSYSECCFTIVAHATEAPFPNSIHIDVIRPEFPLEQGVMTDVTPETCTVYPVREEGLRCIAHGIRALAGNGDITQHSGCMCQGNRPGQYNEQQYTKVLPCHCGPASARWQRGQPVATSKATLP